MGRWKLSVPLAEQEEFTLIRDRLAKHKGLADKTKVAEWKHDLIWEVLLEDPLDFLLFKAWIPAPKPRHKRVDINPVKFSRVLIGQDIAAELLAKMAAAKKRLYIASPYVSEQAMEIFDCVKADVKDSKILFSTAFSEETKRADLPEGILERLVKHERVEDEDKQKEKENCIEALEAKKEEISKESYSYWLLIFVAIALLSYFGLPHLLELRTSYAMIGGILSLLAMYRCLSRYFTSKHRRIQKMNEVEEEIAATRDWEVGRIVYKMQNEETYRCLLEEVEKPRKLGDVSKLDLSELAFSHMNLYIIDDIAFLGSMNFTETSFASLEVLVEVQTTAAVDKLAKYFLDLYQSKKFHTPKDISGKVGK